MELGQSYVNAQGVDAAGQKVPDNVRIFSKLLQQVSFQFSLM